MSALPTTDFANLDKNVRVQLTMLWGITPHLQTTGKQFATVIRVGTRFPAPEGIPNLRIPLRKIAVIFRHGIIHTRPPAPLKVCPNPGCVVFCYPPAPAHGAPQTEVSGISPPTGNISTGTNTSPPNKNGSVRLSDGYFMAITV